MLAPAFFAGKITLGTMFQLRSIIDQVSGSLTFPIEAYGSMVKWRAVTDRLVALLETAKLSATAAKALPPPGGGPGPALLAVQQLVACAPDGRVLLRDFSLRVVS